MPRETSSRRITTLLLVLLWASLAAVGPASSQSSDGEERPFPARVLITNDNGIDDPKIVALARAFSQRAETWVVAPARDRSGSGSTLTVTLTGKLEVESRDLGPRFAPTRSTATRQTACSWALPA